MPIMYMLSLIRVSFSRTSIETMLKTGGTNMRMRARGKISPQTRLKKSLILVSAGRGLAKSDIAASSFSVSSLRMILAAKLWSVSYPLRKYAA